MKQDKGVSMTKRRKQLTSYLVSYAMIAPAIAFLMVFVIYPMFHIIQLSLYRGNATNPTSSLWAWATTRTSSLSRRTLLRR